MDKIHWSLAEYQCGEWQCKYCHEYFVGKHNCTMNAGEMKIFKLKHLYFDLETDQSDGEHKANLAVSQTCYLCQDETAIKNSKCNQCKRCSKCNKFDEK